MDFSFLAAAHGITSTYLNNSSANSISALSNVEEEAKKQFGKEFAEAYDSMMATRMLDSSMRQSYSAAHQDDLWEHQSRLGFSIDNRVIDMLGIQLSDEMNEKVNTAMENAMNSMMNNM